MTDTQANLFDLTGKIAVVTGGSRGLGRAIVLAFARAGADVAIASRKLAACEATAQEVRALGRKALPVACHVGKWDELQRLADVAYETFGRVDILVNNAGMSPLAPSSVETSEELFNKIVDVNFKGVFRLTALIGSRMAQAGAGSIINVSSVGAMRPRPFIAPYAGAKAALNAVSIAFAEEFGKRGVRVNVISPGGFLTDVSGAWSEDQELLSTVALGRFGQPNEIVTTALYLASEQSSYTTGANIRVDGGGR
ncbi:MAG: gdhI 2 [Gammaproteobacteria bacterium]|nr:gdhI 2 [Gammaproteobacteria bacterium]